MYPAEYRYTKEHEWIKKEGDSAVVGITEYAQKELGDIVYVELPSAGKRYKAGEPFGTIESVKAVSEVYAPVAMEVLEVNQKVVDQPELINDAPHDKGWLAKIKVLDNSEIGSLMTADQYQELIGRH
jgi:glycine cleavage system H protein